MKLSDWMERGRFLHCRGNAIFCMEGGRGEALICIHGYPTASWDWHRIWPDLTGPNPGLVVLHKTAAGLGLKLAALGQAPLGP